MERQNWKKILEHFFLKIHQFQGKIRQNLKMIEKADFESNRKGGRSDQEVFSIFNHFKS